MLIQFLLENKVFTSVCFFSFVFEILAPPAVTKVEVDPPATGPNSIGFTWDSLTCQNINGRFHYYVAKLYKSGSVIGGSYESLERKFDQQASSVSFDKLDLCTMYELQINAVNHDQPSGPLATAIGATQTNCKLNSSNYETTQQTME